MLAEGVTINSQNLCSAEYSAKLKEKILEEAKEVASSDSVHSLTIELADLIEVIYAVAANYQIPLELIETERLKKRETNGYFDQTTYVNYIEVPNDNNKVLEYLLSIGYSHDLERSLVKSNE